MKNLFVLPTDKTSRLFVYDGKLGLAKESQYGSDAIQNQKIYITSDEEIKKGDWCIDLDSYFVFEFTTAYKHKRVKKIILTTDQDLIKDGVQAIFDDFLEWFVKNPSCEEFEIERWTDYKLKNNEEVIFFNYEIIIPKEEPKQETLEEAKENAWDNYVHVEGNLYSTSFKNGFVIGVEWYVKNLKEKEKLKEATEKNFINIGGLLVLEDGAKWQQEQDKKMYSEEEVKLILFARDTYYQLNTELLDIDEWFEQFKKK